MAVKPVLVTLLTMAVAFCCSATSATAEPPAKSRLVFVNGDRIVAIDADGSDRLPLTSRSKSLDEYDEQLDTAPRVSPDGSNFLFLREVDDDSGEYVKLMVGAMDGSGARMVTSEPALEPKRRFSPLFQMQSAAWSQDGNRIIFSQQTSTFRFHRSSWVSRLRSINVDGSGLKTLATSHVKRSRGKGYTGRGLFGDIDASPADGRLLVTRELLRGDKSELVVVDPQTGRVKRLVRSADEGRWSPDGTRILFLSDRDRTGETCYEGGCAFQSKLYTAKADGSDQRRVQPGGQSGTIVGADWSPDGSRIAFGSDRNMPGILGISMEIYSIEPDGDCLTWLTNGSPESWDPDWSPTTGTNSSPGECGATDRDVHVDPLPAPHPLVDDRPAKWPRLWPGPVYQGHVLTLPSVDGDDLAYFDCARFKRSDCVFGYSALDSRDVCKRAVSDALEAGRYRGMVSRRGAVVLRPVLNWDKNREVILITGGQTINIGVEDLRYKKKTPFADYLKLIDQLRPVGRDDLAGENLQGAVFNRDELKTAAAMTASFKRTRSIAKTAKRFRADKAEVRAYLRFQRDVKKLGPVESVACPD